MIVLLLLLLLLLFKHSYETVYNSITLRKEGLLGICSVFAFHCFCSSDIYQFQGSLIVRVA